MRKIGFFFIFSIIFSTTSLFSETQTSFLSSGSFLPQSGEGTPPSGGGFVPPMMPSAMPSTEGGAPGGMMRGGGEMNQERKNQMDKQRKAEEEWRQNILSTLQNCENYLRIISSNTGSAKSLE